MNFPEIIMVDQTTAVQNRNKKLLIIEPFYGGSHKILLDTVMGGMDTNSYEVITMPGSKWHWRARCSALYISQIISREHQYTHLFCSSVLPLAELIGLRPDLDKLHKTVYFHENQLVYPVRVTKKRDYQYGHNEITTCLVADMVLFNSKFNMDSFLMNIKKFIDIMPDYRPKNLSDCIKLKSHVVYFPLDLKNISILKLKYEKCNSDLKNETFCKHLVWPHRWEFDKNPTLLMQTLNRLKKDSVPFKISILGAAFSQIPPEFKDLPLSLKDELLHFGFVDSKDEYFEILLSADIVLSTTDHEFFGVSVAEAVECGCVPLLPNKLVYPELYPPECLYDTADELFLKLKKMCQEPSYFGSLKESLNIDFSCFCKKKWLDNIFYLMKLSECKYNAVVYQLDPQANSLDNRCTIDRGNIFYVHQRLGGFISFNKKVIFAE